MLKKSQSQLKVLEKPKGTIIQQSVLKSVPIRPPIDSYMKMAGIEKGFSTEEDELQSHLSESVITEDEPKIYETNVRISNSKLKQSQIVSIQSSKSVLSEKERPSPQQQQSAANSLRGVCVVIVTFGFSIVQSDWMVFGWVS